MNSLTRFTVTSGHATCRRCGEEATPELEVGYPILYQCQRCDAVFIVRRMNETDFGVKERGE